MPNPTRRIIALAVLAAAIVAGAVALDLPSAAAQDAVTMQSDEPHYGKITARRTASDRIEFGWQPTSASGEAIGPRVLPSARFMPPNAPIDRWLNSSPVEVAGETIGQINARRLAVGRIEFGFTPINGERILPPARYLSANATRGRWLRSSTIQTRIQIDEPIPPVSSSALTPVSAGALHSCGLHESGAIECWGRNTYGESSPPAGSFTAVSVGAFHSCGLRSDSAIVCWGRNRYAQADPPRRPL